MTKPDQQHQDYIDNLDAWKKCRDAVAGQRAIKAGGELYLPMLAGQERDNYNKYVARANYFNASGRTVDAMTGLVFRKPMKTEEPATVKEWYEDITLTEETLTDFIETCLSETIIAGRGGILVDMPVASDQNLTIAQAEATAIRPYLTLYKTESIINWEMKRINNVYKLFNVWLEETYRNDKGEDRKQIRQLTLENGFYEQVIWRAENGTDYQEFNRIAIKKKNAAVIEIPFYPLAPRKPTMAVVPPPIESLVDVNIAHYMNSADLENGAHVAGQPTPVVTGVDANGPDGKPYQLYIGSSTTWMLPEGADAKYLQCGSEGFSSLEKLMDRKEEQMAALGARMLAPEKKDAEAQGTHEIKRSGENSILSAIAGVLERQIEKALRFAADWSGIAGDISIELNRDFFPPEFAAQDLTAWVAARQAGEISKETLFNVLKFSEWLPDDVTFEDEQERIKDDGPALGTLNADGQ